MNNNTVIEKSLGLVLLLVGLFIIGYSLHLGINIYINGQNPPEIFKPIAAVPNPEATLPASSATPVPKNLNEINPVDLQKMVSNNSITPEMIKSIIPQDIFNYAPRLMNLTVFSIFLWVLITAGAKIASLGVALIKSNSDIKF